MIESQRYMLFSIERLKLVKPYKELTLVTLIC
jgi:hypothetical protein